VVAVAPLQIITTNLQDALEGQPYSAILQATGGLPPLTWTIVSANLPPGLSLSSDGVISGPALKSGCYDFTVQVADSGTPQQTATREFRIDVQEDDDYGDAKRVH
jgi:hypothetical protein